MSETTYYKKNQRSHFKQRKKIIMKIKKNY